MNDISTNNKTTTATRNTHLPSRAKLSFMFTFFSLLISFYCKFHNDEIENKTLTIETNSNQILNQFQFCTSKSNPTAFEHISLQFKTLLLLPFVKPLLSALYSHKSTHQKQKQLMKLCSKT